MRRRGERVSSSMESLTFMPIGWVVSGRHEVRDDGWEQVESVIELDAGRFGPEALLGLEEFSHLEVIFFMHRVRPEKIHSGARRPRNNPAWPRMGIFAQRAKNRPNPIGTTVCRLRAVEGLRIRLTGLDAVVGSPVLDLKPWFRELAPRGEIRQPAWVEELMKNYWVES